MFRRGTVRCTGWLPAVVLLTVLASSCGGRKGGEGGRDGAPGPPASSSTGPIFTEQARELGLDFVHFNGMSGEYYMVEVLGPGGALLDYDNDDDLDVYLVQGSMLGPGKSIEGALVAPRHPLPLTDRLYRNDLEVTDDGVTLLRFTDVTEESGLADTGYGMGVAAGDYDNDGWMDLYVTNFGPNQLLHNNGDGTFSDVTRQAGAGDERWSVPAAFFDYDGDGWLDLFVGNYVAFDFERLPICRDLTGAQDYCGPAVFPVAGDRLLRNRSDGTFEDVTAEAGLHGGFGPALGAVAADLDGNGWLDLYVANDAKPNNFWRNGGGSFTDQALLAGCAVNAGGKPEGSMGVDAGDFDADGDLDLFMTHLTKETNTLYVNDGQGMFDDRTADTGLGPLSQPYTSFGTAWFDYDNDGWLDLLIVNGAVTKIQELAQQGDPYPLHQPNQLLRNLGPAQERVRFQDVTAQAGEAFGLSEVSRGAVFGDVDNDGDTDVLVTNNNGPVRLLLNNVGNRRPWLGVRLAGGEPPRDMPGARAAILRRGGPALWRRVRVDGSYASANDPRLLFGLGDDPRIEGVRVVWPDGSSEDFTGAEPGRYTTLVQGTGAAVDAP